MMLYLMKGKKCMNIHLFQVLKIKIVLMFHALHNKIKKKIMFKFNKKLRAVNLNVMLVSRRVQKLNVLVKRLIKSS